MNLLVVNYSHPDLPHISAKRLPTFARHLSARGHRVVLLTRTLPEGVATAGETDHPTAGHTATLLPARLAAHDWQTPFVLAVPPQPGNWLLNRVRNPQTPAWGRRLGLLYHYVARRGRLFTDWSTAADRLLPALVAHFKPHLCWGTFGQTDVLWLTRRAARLAGVPYVIDLKDPWRVFVPAPFRHYVARPYADAAALTLNARFQEPNGLRWFPTRPHRVIYSGFEPSVGANSGRARAERSGDSRIFTVTLVGSLYHTGHLRDLLNGLLRGFAQLPPSARPRLVYAGADAAQLRNVVAETPWPFGMEVHDFLPYDALFGLYGASDVLAYVAHADTFHHKSVELLATGRPVVAYPAESEETRTLARQYAARLHVCAVPADVANVVVTTYRHGGPPTPNTALLARFDWAALSAEVDAFFATIIPQSDAQPERK